MRNRFVIFRFLTKKFFQDKVDKVYSFADWFKFSILWPFSELGTRPSCWTALSAAHGSSRQIMCRRRGLAPEICSWFEARPKISVQKWQTLEVTWSLEIRWACGILHWAEQGVQHIRLGGPAFTSRRSLWSEMPADAASVITAKCFAPLWKARCSAIFTDITETPLPVVLARLPFRTLLWTKVLWRWYLDNWCDPYNSHLFSSLVTT